MRFALFFKATENGVGPGADSDGLLTPDTNQSESDRASEQQHPCRRFRNDVEFRNRCSEEELGTGGAWKLDAQRQILKHAGIGRAVGGIGSLYRIRDRSKQLQFDRENRAIHEIEVEPDRFLILNVKGWDRASRGQIIAVEGYVAQSGVESYRHTSSILNEGVINLKTIIAIQGLDLRQIPGGSSRIVK